MKIAVTCLLQLMTILCIVSCEDARTSSGHVNPMLGIWNQIASTIDNLEASKATPDKWAANAEHSEEVHTEQQMSLLIARMAMPADERAALVRIYKSSDKVVHYGFEGDFHALVFFDDQSKAQRVVKW